VYGKDGIFSDLAPDLTKSKLAIDSRKQRAANQKATRRALLSATKRHKAGEESAIHNNRGLLSEPILIPGPVVPDRGAIVLVPADTHGLLTFGTLLNGNVVLGYLNLLAVKFNGLGIPVRIVMPQFYPTFLLEGWNKVQGWVRATGFMETNWETAPIILVPIFTGSIFSGHWSGFTVGRPLQIG
jgi:hypothetical protein